MNKCRRSHCKLRVHRAYTMTVWVWSAALRTLHFPPLYFQTNFIFRFQYLFTCICEKVSALSLWHLADGIMSMHDLQVGSYFTAVPFLRQNWKFILLFRILCCCGSAVGENIFKQCIRRCAGFVSAWDKVLKTSDEAQLVRYLVAHWQLDLHCPVGNFRIPVLVKFCDFRAISYTL